MGHLVQSRQRGIPVKIHGIRQIRLSHQGHVCGMEHGGILQRLVLPFRDGKQDHAHPFPQIIGSGTHQVPHILNHQHIQVIKRHPLHRLRNHAGIQMAHCTGGNLHYGNIRTAQAFGVMIRSQVSNNHPHSDTVPQHLRRLLQQGCLAGAGRGKYIDDQQLLCFKKTSVAFRQTVIGIQHGNMDVHAVGVSFMGVFTSASAIFTHNQY